MVWYGFMAWHVTCQDDIVTCACQVDISVLVLVDIFLARESISLILT